HAAADAAGVRSLDLARLPGDEPERLHPVLLAGTGGAGTRRFGARARAGKLISVKVRRRGLRYRSAGFPRSEPCDSTRYGWSTAPAAFRAGRTSSAAATPKRSRPHIAY